MEQQARQMTKKLAMEAEIQKSFAEGRTRVMREDANLRRQFLGNMLQEQKWLLEEPDLRNRLIESQLKARSEALRQKEVRNHLLLQGLEERALTARVYPDKVMEQALSQQEKMLKEPYAQKLLDHTLNVQDAILQSRRHKARLMDDTLHTFSGIVHDAGRKAQMADLMLVMMQDPKMKAALEQMIQMAVKKQMKALKQEMQPTHGTRQSPAHSEKQSPSEADQQGAERHSLPAPKPAEPSQTGTMPQTMPQPNKGTGDGSSS